METKNKYDEKERDPFPYLIRMSN